MPGPLIFLDVDGPLIPFRARSFGPVEHENPLVERLDPADGGRLLALGGALVWATTWMDDANEVIAPILAGSRRTVRGGRCCIGSTRGSAWPVATSR
ncbi:hypothetical protein GCM10010172_64530 [Paractinoplanes ferrugineus]|uniref:Uncharacterized protein n=1 Tax=Paractinoplanes ferrugineus TaxID=113564 RepID=A0A919MQ51_9ACTN|nr:hypothetical protein Afe05nite_78170 [Actinoplanes ferrugineus]